MKRVIPVFLELALVLVFAPAAAQDVEPSCQMCASTYVSAEEIQEYLQIDRLDQRIRTVDIGKANLQVAVVHRGQLDEPRGAAEHSLVTEFYHVISGSGTNVTGPELIDPVPREAENRAVQTLNGLGHNAAGIQDGTTHELETGDVFVIPAGTGHQYTRIEDHITYVLIRVDPDEVLPLMDEAESRAYLNRKANR